jgi:hypothetical protein
LVWGDSPFTPVSYTTHNNDITQLFNEGNWNSTSATVSPNIWLISF